MLGEELLEYIDALSLNLRSSMLLSYAAFRIKLGALEVMESFLLVPMSGFKA
jgi:hypothetical protein